MPLENFPERCRRAMQRKQPSYRTEQKQGRQRSSQPAG